MNVHWAQFCRTTDKVKLNVSVITLWSGFGTNTTRSGLGKHCCLALVTTVTGGDNPITFKKKSHLCQNRNSWKCPQITFKISTGVIDRVRGQQVGGVVSLGVLCKRLKTDVDLTLKFFIDLCLNFAAFLQPGH